MFAMFINVYLLLYIYKLLGVGHDLTIVIYLCKYRYF